MKHSLRKKITLVFVIILLAVTAGSMIFNYAFLEKVYESQKEDNLMEIYELANAAIADGDDITDSEDTLREQCMKYNISLVVMSSDYSILVSSGGESDFMQNQFLDARFGHDNDIKMLEENDNYIMQKRSAGLSNGGFIELFGSLSNGDAILMQIALSSIKDSVSISQDFLLIASLISLVIGSIIIYMVTRSITRPIVQLSDISQRMAQLDFTAKYEGKEKNEIGELGHHMNEMSGALEQTISELKTANNELKTDLDRKQKIDEMRTEFLSNVSHELKTPIALIQGYAEGLEECAEDPDTRSFYTEVIVDEAKKMNALVQQLLTLNQIEFGENEIVMEHIDLDEIIRGVIGNMTIMLQQENITLEYDHEGPLMVWADAFKTEEVLTNYMSNAIHHIDGEKIIRILVEPVGTKLRIHVMNTGHQIPEDEMQKLWEKFYKADKSHSRQYGGSGIGLSIVKAIMDAFHENFGVRNVEDGVDFWFELDQKAEVGEVHAE